MSDMKSYLKTAVNMNVVNSTPPNFGDILAVFPDAIKPGVIFTYGNTIYNPSGVELSSALRAHEGIHCGRQGAEVGRWWARYLVDAEFRLEEELLGHRAEYRTFIGTTRNREAHNNYLQQIANRLASPLYGNLLSMQQARKAITK